MKDAEYLVMQLLYSSKLHAILKMKNIPKSLKTDNRTEMAK